MKISLKNKIVVITGAGSGIGRAIARTLASEGAKIVLCVGNNIRNLEETARLVKDTGSEAYTLPGNLGDDEFLLTVIDKIHNKFGGLDVLINNAGIALNAPFEETLPEQLDHIYKINVRAPFILCQKALPYLRESDQATIINISSTVGHKGYPNQAAYAASKHAILGFSKSLANEVYKENIRVHTICPGGVFTDMVKIARPDLSEDGMILPEEISEIVLFFLKFRGNAVIDEISVHRAGKEPFQ